jgi:hypothetical protein
LAEAVRRVPLVAQAAAKDAQAEDEDAQVWAVLDATIDPAMRGESLEWNATGWAHRFPGRRYSMDEAQRVLRDLQQRQPHCRTMYVARKG